MSKEIQIGSTIYTVPEEGDNPGWGEDLTEFFCAIGAALQNVQGPNDILTTSATLANNQTTFIDIPGLIFNTAQVQRVEVKYLVTRVFDAGVSTIVESGIIEGNYDGSLFKIATKFLDDAGIEFDVTNAGQFQYKTTDLTDHVSTTIRFEAVTIDQAI